jgi:hypothetical protein
LGKASFIFNEERFGDENFVPSAGIFDPHLGVVSVFALAGGISPFLQKLGPARKRGFFVG